MYRLLVFCIFFLVLYKSINDLVFICMYVFLFLVMKFYEKCKFLSFILFNFLKGVSMYLGVVLMVVCLESYRLNVLIILSVVDVVLFLVLMVWKFNFFFYYSVLGFFFFEF